MASFDLDKVNDNLNAAITFYWNSQLLYNMLSCYQPGNRVVNGFLQNKSVNILNSAKNMLYNMQGRGLPIFFIIQTTSRVLQPSLSPIKASHPSTYKSSN